MVAHEMVFVLGEGSSNETILGLPISYSSIPKRRVKIADPRRFSIVWKVKNVNHILCFFFFHDVPAFFGHVLECGP